MVLQLLAPAGGGIGRVDVAIEQNTLAVTFSLWNLTVTAAMFALVLIILVLVIYWLIRHPSWGLNIVEAVVSTVIRDPL